jgi:hypothetical protein
MQDTQKVLEEAFKKVDDVLKNAQVLLGLSEKDKQILKLRKDLLQSWADEIIDHFYAVMLKSDEARAIVEKHKIDINDLKRRNKEWYKWIVSGEIDERFFRYSFYVGLLHIYYDVDNDLMIFMADVLRRKFLELCMETFEEGEAFEVYQAFSKIVAAFVGFTVEGYVFMLSHALLDILGMKPQLVNRMMKMQLREFLKAFREHFGVAKN